MLQQGKDKLQDLKHSWLQSYFLKNGPTPASFCLFSFFLITNFTDKPVGFSRIWTRIVEIEVEQADHLTTTMALKSYLTIVRGRCKEFLFRGCLYGQSTQKVSSAFDSCWYRINRLCWIQTNKKFCNTLDFSTIKLGWKFVYF